MDKVIRKKYDFNEIEIYNTLYSCYIMYAYLFPYEKLKEFIVYYYMYKEDELISLEEANSIMCDFLNSI